jgi:hypothetical protein
MNMTTYNEIGAAIRGRRIACEYRGSSPLTLAKGSHKHKKQKATLYEAFCRIETAYILKKS